jgi:hypothetical protein
LYRFSFASWITSAEPFASHGRKRLRPFIPVGIFGPTGSDVPDVFLDTGAEFSLFPEWVGWRIGVRRHSKSPNFSVGSSIGGAAVIAWFAPVELEIRDPAGIQPPFRWSAIVGFTPAGTFSTGHFAGLLGVNGGFDQFQSAEFGWAATSGPEIVIRT